MTGNNFYYQRYFSYVLRFYFYLAFLLIFLSKIISFIDFFYNDVIFYVVPENTDIPNPSSPRPSLSGNDSVTIQDVNKRLDNIENALTKIGEGVSKAGTYIGGGWGIAKVVQVIPHPGGKVIVGGVGLGTMFLSGAIRSIFKGPNSQRGSGSLNFAPSAFAPIVAPLGETKINNEYIEICLQVCSVSSFFIYILIVFLVMELFRKSIFKFLQDQRFPKIINQVGFFFEKKAFQSFSSFYILVLVVLILVNIAYVFIAIEGLKVALDSKKEMLQAYLQTLNCGEALLFIAMFLVLIILVNLFTEKFTNILPQKLCSRLPSSTQKFILVLGSFLLWLDAVFLGFIIFYITDETRSILKHING